MNTLFEQVSADAIANVYYSGKVVSHTILTHDGQKKTLGVILPGNYHFKTDAAEYMEITVGECRVVNDGQTKEQLFRTGESFTIPAKSGFTIRVGCDYCQYICSFLA